MSLVGAELQRWVGKASAQALHLRRARAADGPALERARQTLLELASALTTTTWAGPLTVHDAASFLEAMAAGVDLADGVRRREGGGGELGWVAPALGELEGWMAALWETGGPTLTDLHGLSFVLSRRGGAMVAAAPELASALDDFVERLRARIEAHPVFARARALQEAVRAGALDGAGLLREVSGDELSDHALLAAVFGALVRPVDPPPQRFEPSPLAAFAAHLEALELAEGEVFYDLGSGLGLPVMYAALATGADCRGVELQERHVAHARRAAAALGLGNARFVCEDARTADLSAGDAFYLFNPFGSEALQAAVGRRMAKVALHHPIRVACMATTLEPPFEPTAELPGEGTLYRLGPAGARAFLQGRAREPRARGPRR